jgi:NAD(P)-dependent dehydrogenase (short-subunit alcohol dehydrogenase family)
MSERLAGRHVVITGAAGGLGPVAAAAAVAEGAQVTLVDTSQQRLDDVAAGIRAGSAAGIEAAGTAGAVAAPPVLGTHVVDLLDPAATAALADDLVAAHGGVDVVWHLVGGWKGGTPFEESPAADWALLHDLAVRTTVHVAQAFTSALLASPHGRFAIVSAPAAQRPTSSAPAYSAMKAAAEAATLSLADRFAGSSATANVVVVTAILTPAMKADEPDKVRPAFVEAEHLADALVFVSSDTARTMNGQRLRLTPAGS